MAEGIYRRSLHLQQYSRDKDRNKHIEWSFDITKEQEQGRKENRTAVGTDGQSQQTRAPALAVQNIASNFRIDICRHKLAHLLIDAHLEIEVHGNTEASNEKGSWTSKSKVKSKRRIPLYTCETTSPALVGLDDDCLLSSSSSCDTCIIGENILFFESLASFQAAVAAKTDVGTNMNTGNNIETKEYWKRVVVVVVKVRIF